MRKKICKLIRNKTQCAYTVKRTYLTWGTQKNRLNETIVLSTKTQV